MLATLSMFLSLVGIYALAGYLSEQLRTPFQLLKVRLATDPKQRPTLKERYGSWAAITGSSDGIGREYAKELARQGINLVLIARNEQKLKAVEAEILAECKVQTKIVIADFTKGPQVYEHIERELADLPITILINNAGIGLTGGIYQLTKEQIEQLIETNVMAVTHLSRYFFKRLRDSKTKGAIVNVGSGTELQPVPYAALYSASKAYTRSFTLALQFEAAPFGIHVQLLSPNFVVTQINSYSSRIMRGGLLIPTAKTYARSAVAHLRDGVDATSAYVWHGLQNAISIAFPWRLRLIAAQWFLKQVQD